VSDPTAKDIAKPQTRFVSLKWKSIITLTAVLSALLVLLSWHFYDQYQRSYQARLNKLRLLQLEELERNVYRSGETLHQLIDSVVIEDPSLISHTNFDLTAYRQSVRSMLPKVWGLGRIEEAVLVTADNQVLEHLPINPDKPQPLVSWITRQGWQQLPQTPFSVHCIPQCIQVLIFPITNGNTRIATLAVSRDLTSLEQQFYAQTTSHFWLFASEPALKSDNPGIDWELNPSKLIPSWHGGIIMGGADKELEEALRVASKLFSPGSLIGASKSFTHGDRIYAISVMPLRGYEDLRIRYLLLSDFTDEHQLLKNNASQDLLVVFCLVALFTAYILGSNWRHFGRVKQQITLLPLLSQKKFSEVRDIVLKNRRRTWLHDELDTLDDAVSDFSYQLESLEKAVNIRTREMERLSLFDTLTGLANRNLLQYELQSDVQRFSQQGGVLAVVVLDLDKFKRINDSVGHQLGDLLLGKIGGR